MFVRIAVGLVVVVLLVGAGALVAWLTRSHRFLHERRRRGEVAARDRLDELFPTNTRLARSRVGLARRRMVALALLGDLETLEREVRAHVGPPALVAEVNAVALVGLALRGTDPRGAMERIDDLHRRLRRQAGSRAQATVWRLGQLTEIARSGGCRPDLATPYPRDRLWRALLEEGPQPRRPARALSPALGVVGGIGSGVVTETTGVASRATRGLARADHLRLVAAPHLADEGR
jgi:hypothetical protein